MNWRRLLALSLLLAAGCGKRDEAAPTRPPGLLDSEGRPVSVAPAAPPAAPSPSPRPEPTTYDFERPSAPDPGSLTAPAGTRPEPAAAPAQAAAPAAPTRDLSAELSAGLEPISDCIDVPKAAAQPGGKLAVAVSASVLGSGRISRATVTAPGQPASALGCIERHVLALKLGDPVPNAPLTVQATTQLQFKAVPAAPGSAAAPAVPAPANIPPQPVSGDVAQPEPPDIAGPP